jgi:ATP-dependent helicase HrpA
MAREVFIRSALVEGEYRPETPFLAWNLALREEVEGLEHKARRQDILVDEDTVFRFYDARIPPGVASERQLEAWRREVERGEPRHLFLTREDLMRHAAEGTGPGRFPDLLEVGGARLPLVYRFEPGQEGDGVTVRVPVTLLGGLAPEQFEWLVPGLLEEKLTALIRGLPRPIRKHFVPAPDFARACAEALGPAQGSLVDALGRALERMTGFAVPTDAWDPEALPTHLRMRFEVVDGEGRVLAAGRDLGRLQDSLGETVRERLSAAVWPGLSRARARRWVFGDLPERVESVEAGIPIVGYPALVDDGDAVSVRAFPDPDEAAAAHREGLARLFLLDLTPQLAALERRLPGIETMCLAYSTLPDSPGVNARDGRDAPCAELRRDLVRASVDRAFLGAGAVIRTEAVYRERRDAGRARLGETVDQVCAQAGDALTLYREVARQLESLGSPGAASARDDIRRQLRHLVYRGFVRQTPADRLPHLPRYLKAILRRLERLPRDPRRDASHQAAVERLWQPCLAAREALRARGRSDPELEELRWLLEELRVSLLAQDLRAAEPVSVARLQRRWEALRARLPGGA